RSSLYRTPILRLAIWEPFPANQRRASPRPSEDGAMEAHDVLQRMSQLVRERPDITVRELADALEYSQERSVYYWLNKAGFRGIRQFRDAVLRGEWAGSAGNRSQAGGCELPLNRLSQLPLDRDLPPPSSRRLEVEPPPAPEA